MGLSKAVGEHIDEMTEPSGWPDVDEYQLRGRSGTLAEKASQLLWILESWQKQHAEIFEGGVWRGGAADSASTAVQSRVNDMLSLNARLENAISWYGILSDVVTQTKVAINENLEEAQQYFATIRVEERRIVDGSGSRAKLGSAAISRAQ